MRYCTNDETSRAQFAVFMARTFKFGGEAHCDDTLCPATQFSPGGAVGLGAPDEQGVLPAAGQKPMAGCASSAPVGSSDGLIFIVLGLLFVGLTIRGRRRSV